MAADALERGEHPGYSGAFSHFTLMLVACEVRAVGAAAERVAR